MIDINKLDFEKGNGLIPAIITDIISDEVLMLGYMNREAVEKSVNSGKVTFFSRTKNRLWTKGETSGNFLYLKEILPDCDNDALLIKVNPVGNTCHKDTKSCFGEKSSNYSFLKYLYNFLGERKINMPEGSYTTKLYKKGSDKIIQKVGEEAVETVIAAKNRDKSEIINETSDLIYHLFVMLNEQDIDFQEIVDNLSIRHK